jgi:HEPN domain-containing protein
MCHLSLEKILKAHVELHENKFPPKIHHLIKLAKRAELEIPEKLNSIIVELNEASIPTRYPEDLQKSLHTFTKQFSARVLKETEETLKWLQTHPRFATL